MQEKKKWRLLNPEWMAEKAVEKQYLIIKQYNGSSIQYFTFIKLFLKI